MTKEGLEKVCNFMKEAKVYYLATVESNQPRVRPFGTAHIYKDRLYIQTGKCKPTSKQIAENNKVEISAMVGGDWLRLRGTLIEDDTVEARKSMLDAYPELRNMYDENDGNTQVLYFDEINATIYSFTRKPEIIK